MKKSKTCFWMFLLYSSTSSSVCIEVSAGACLTWGAAAGSYPLKNGIILSSTVWPHRHIRMCPTSIKPIFSLSCRTGSCFNSSSLLMIFTGGISVSPILGLILGQCCPFSPGRCCGVQAPKAVFFLRLFTGWGSSTCERAEGREGWGGQRKGKKKQLPVCL